jgi:hypothetical protein
VRTAALDAAHLRELIRLAHLAGELEAIRDRTRAEHSELRERLALAASVIDDAVVELERITLQRDVGVALKKRSTKGRRKPAARSESPPPPATAADGPTPDQGGDNG